jgi:hypothetical protein
MRVWEAISRRRSAVARIKELERRLAGQESAIAAERAAKAQLQAEVDRQQVELSVAKPFAQEPSYRGDFLATWNKSVDFLADRRFTAAYRRGMDSGHAIGRPRGSNLDIHIEWRIHTCVWAGWHARQLPGDFVECGVNTGIMSLAVCDYVDFEQTGKTFWLFDTFDGIPLDQLTEEESRAGRGIENSLYFECYDLVQRNFALYSRARLVRGRVPETLAQAAIGDVAYLSIDMNIVDPEIAALEHFWPKLVRGAVVVLDDYGWKQCAIQKRAHDAFARRVGAEILLLPTGQGLMIKA